MRGCTARALACAKSRKHSFARCRSPIAHSASACMTGFDELTQLRVAGASLLDATVMLMLVARAQLGRAARIVVDRLRERGTCRERGEQETGAIA